MNKMKLYLTGVDKYKLGDIVFIEDTDSDHPNIINKYSWYHWSASDPSSARWLAL